MGRSGIFRNVWDGTSEGDEDRTRARETSEKPNWEINEEFSAVTS